MCRAVACRVRGQPPRTTRSRVKTGGRMKLGGGKGRTNPQHRSSSNPTPCPGKTRRIKHFQEDVLALNLVGLEIPRWMLSSGLKTADGQPLLKPIWRESAKPTYLGTGETCLGTVVLIPSSLWTSPAQITKREQSPCQSPEASFQDSSRGPGISVLTSRPGVPSSIFEKYTSLFSIIFLGLPIRFSPRD